MIQYNNTFHQWHPCKCPRETCHQTDLATIEKVSMSTASISPDRSLSLPWSSFSSFGQQLLHDHGNEDTHTPAIRET